MFEEPNSFLEVTKVGDKEVAFALKIRGAGKRNKGILGGVFKEYLKEGFGVISMLDERALRNGEKKKTVVSSNNLDVVKLHQQCGRIIYDEMYVLRRFF